MFGGGFWGAGFAGSDDHLTKEREPPPRPIALEFPKYTPPFTPATLTRGLSSRIQYKICHSRGIADLSDNDLASLNINYTHDVALESLIPVQAFACRPLLYDGDLQSMLDEIGVSNEDAFREVLRLDPLPGRQKPRLAYARNFFGSLEDMARYWDDRQDNYYMIPTETSRLKAEANKQSNKIAPASVSTEEHPRNERDADKDISMADVSNTTPLHNVQDETREVYKGYRISNGEAMNPGARVAMTKNLLKMVMHKFNCRDHEPMPAPREKFTIRGVKLQSIQYHFCVARVPNDQKQARARLVEGPLMAVLVREELRFKAKEGLSTPEKTGFVGEKFDLLREVGCMLIIARQRAREGTNAQQDLSRSEQWWVSRPRWGGGPTHWGQLAHEVFEDEDPSWGSEEKKLQQAKREREKDYKSETLDATLAAVNAKKLGVEDLLAGAERAAAAVSAPGPIPTSNISILDPRHRKKKLRSMERPPGDDPSMMRDGKRLMYTPPFRRKWYQEWQKLRPNTSTQDDRIIYKQIGKVRHRSSEDKGGEDDTGNSTEDRRLKGGFDDIFLVSSANHHVCLTKMRVHPAYLAWLESGQEVSAGFENMDDMQNVLYVSRSEWYDMFDVEARKQFLTGLWMVMSWLNRDVVPEAERELMERKKKEAGAESGNGSEGAAAAATK